MHARPVSVVLGLVGLVGCSLLVDTSELDAGCPAGQKYCGRCVGETDPAYGCVRGVCTPCELPHAISECRNGSCAAKACLYGYGCEDCTESILTDEAHCGACQHACAGEERCVAGACVGCSEPCDTGEHCERANCVPD